MTSIRQRTLGLALLVFGISMLVIGFISYRYAAHEIEALYDASLEQNARLLEGAWLQGAVFGLYGAGDYRDVGRGNG